MKVFALSSLLMPVLLTPLTAGAGEETLMRVLVVIGKPGHNAVHLQRGDRQLYWDPGGEYGTEMDQCLERTSKESHCNHLEGMDLERISEGRSNDVFMGEDAEFIHLLSVYHLDQDQNSYVYTYRLNGDQGQRAWDLLYDGSRLGGKAEFSTNRLPSMCVKSVAEYLNEVGGQFADLPRPWFPSRMQEELEKRGARPSAMYTLSHPEIQGYIRQRRSSAGLQPLLMQAEDKVVAAPQATAVE